MDTYLFQKINQFTFSPDIFNSIAVFFANYFGYFLIFLVFLFLLKRKWRTFLVAFISAFLSRFVFTEIIRLFWDRQRPFVEQSVNLLFEHADKASFPSGHAAFYFALATAVFLRDRKMGWFFLAGALIISLARVYSGIHWPSDILAGALVGILSALLVNRFFKKGRTR